MSPANPLIERRAGVILHPTSLPSRLGKGDLGPEAYRFVEFMAASGLRVWQVLPLS
ncbi:MAG TPA: 4-alpha-glucanotransferase, partial [Gammaproteobacteria bacterium]|nr:4-alpha-glucanotransferase [Gammaproteobacteria bacterium]